jgi:hypothetical protein
MPGVDEEERIAHFPLAHDGVASANRSTIQDRAQHRRLRDG